MNVINYNPTLVAENIARLEEETNDYNSSVMKRNRVLDVIGRVLLVFCFLMIVALGVAIVVAETNDGFYLFPMIFAGFTIISITVTFCVVPQLKKPCQDIEYTPAMRYHLAAHGKKVLDARFECYNSDGTIVVFKIKENDNAVSTVKLKFDKIVEKTEIQEPEIDMDKEIVYIPYTTFTNTNINPWFR